MATDTPRERWTRDGNDWTRGIWRLVNMSDGTGWAVFSGDSFHAMDLPTLEDAKAWTRGPNTPN
jgi:hypothetical protein